MRNSSPLIEAVYLVESGNGPAWFPHFYFVMAVLLLFSPLSSWKSFLNVGLSIIHTSEMSKIPDLLAQSSPVWAYMCLDNWKRAPVNHRDQGGGKKEKKRLFVLPSVGCPMFESGDKKIPIGLRLGISIINITIISLHIAYSYDPGSGVIERSPYQSIWANIKKIISIRISEIWHVSMRSSV